MIDLEQIKKLILQGNTVEDILSKFDWKKFEQTISEIFTSNDFNVWKNYRFKTERRFEIDVVASKGDIIFCVDCKSWSGGRYKKTGLKYAVREQEKRVKEFKKFLKKNLIAQDILKIKPTYTIRPLIVTLLEEDLVSENNTFVVPAWKLNTFLLELNNYI